MAIGHGSIHRPYGHVIGHSSMDMVLGHREYAYVIGGMDMILGHREYACSHMS